MFDTPLNYSRPDRAFDGEGSVEALAETPKTLWADPVVMDGRPGLRVHVDEDVKVGDLIEVPVDLLQGG